MILLDLIIGKERRRQLQEQRDAYHEAHQKTMEKADDTRKAALDLVEGGGYNMKALTEVQRQLTETGHERVERIFGGMADRMKS